MTVAAHVTDEDTPQRCGEMTIPRVAVVKITEVKVMPLAKGYSKKSIGKNIKQEMKTRPRKQAIAIALDTARRAAKKAGVPSKGPKRKKKGK